LFHFVKNNTQGGNHDIRKLRCFLVEEVLVLKQNKNQCRNKKLLQRGKAWRVSFIYISLPLTQEKTTIN